MIRKQKKGVFIVWKKFQRRVEDLAPSLDLEVFYFYYSWEDKSGVLKALSYLLKSIETFKCLYKKKPPLVFVQFPPAPALYCVALYSYLTGSRYVSDCHLGLANARWLEWIFVRKLLIKRPVIVHNEHLVEYVIRNLNIQPFVLRDGIPKRQSVDIKKSSMLAELGLSTKDYVIFPGSFSADEPFEEVIQAAKIVPEILFVLTWHFDRLSKTIRNNLPSNIILTGYLQIEDFYYLFANSGVALALTKDEAVQLTCMQEAMAFEIPAVVSDLKTTRFLYKNCPVYVRNDPESIAEGIKYAFRNSADLEEKIKKLRAETEREFFDQIASLRAILNIMD